MIRVSRKPTAGELCRNIYLTRPRRNGFTPVFIAARSPLSRYTILRWYFSSIVLISGSSQSAIMAFIYPSVIHLQKNRCFKQACKKCALECSILALSAVRDTESLNFSSWKSSCKICMSFDADLIICVTVQQARSSDSWQPILKYK